jgi:hypothetical protein
VVPDLSHFDPTTGVTPNPPLPIYVRDPALSIFSYILLRISGPTFSLWIDSSRLGSELLDSTPSPHYHTLSAEARSRAPIDLCTDYPGICPLPGQPAPLFY